MAPSELTAERVLAWRMRRQFLDRSAEPSAGAVATRLCGLHAQLASAAALAVAVRQPAPTGGAVAAELTARRLVKTWAMRGTLHLLPTTAAPDLLALLAAGRFWEKGAWQRSFVSTERLAAIAEATHAALDGRLLTREELTTEIVERTGDREIAGQLGSGWSAVLKPLAWQGLLVQGPRRGNRVTFTRPDTWLDGWVGPVDPGEAASRVVPAYLGAYGPASAATFDQWLSRGGSKRAMLRGWFDRLVEAGELVSVTVDGAPAYARVGDVESITAAAPVDGVRLLPAFDQYVLGPGTKETMIVPPDRRAEVSRAAGWIAPVVLHGGRVVGTWEWRDGAPAVTVWPSSASPPADQLGAEVDRLRAYQRVEQGQEGQEEDDA